ncbi:hypothetical protein MERGE_000936 [Pneumocystis wakefieldiae]|uniref:Uncharacterized protein n=1 Tax=Pneumocystis wakefieldiae TaxID=38082 RepID=A0A899G117_9ASCO|nr:hypothetical protein MERGE_000936 [Pneumocystis wakefieldiae]
MDTPHRIWKRHFCDYKPTLQERYDCYSRWNSWGRWMVVSLVLIMVIFFISCLFYTIRKHSGPDNVPNKYTGWFMPWQTYPQPQSYGYVIPITPSYQHPGRPDGSWQNEQIPIPLYEPPSVFVNIIKVGIFNH